MTRSIFSVVNRLGSTAVNLYLVADSRSSKRCHSYDRYDGRFLIFLSFQCYAWTEYKFTCVGVCVSVCPSLCLFVCLSLCLCVCVSVTLSVNSPTCQTPQRIFTVDSLKDADLRKDVPFKVSMMNNHI